MKCAQKMLLIAAGSLISASTSWADTLPTHRIPAALGVEAANETVAACARQGYRETAVVLDADGAIIAALRGDGAGIHTLDSAHDKAYTAVSFKNDTLALAERAKGEDSIAPLAKLPHVMFFGGGVVIKQLGDEVIGSIGTFGAPPLITWIWLRSPAIKLMSPKQVFLISTDHGSYRAPRARSHRQVWRPARRSQHRRWQHQYVGRRPCA
jgi:uncharacterized protein GlcG (DUF336 family)